MTAEVPTATHRTLRIALVLAVYVGLFFCGRLLDGWITEQLGSPGNSDFAAMLHGMVFVALALYFVLLALPFVPGVEIGFALMMVFGADVAIVVYAVTVAALMTSFLVGRLIPAKACASAFGFVGFRRAQQLVLDVAPLDGPDRLEFLAARSPTWIAQSLLRFRYVGLAVLLNLPGNSIIGGGGGIALMTGMSGVFSVPYCFLAIAIAVLPMPLMFWLGGV